MKNNNRSMGEVLFDYIKEVFEEEKEAIVAVFNKDIEDTEENAGKLLNLLEEVEMKDNATKIAKALVFEYFVKPELEAGFNEALEDLKNSEIPEDIKSILSNAPADIIQLVEKAGDLTDPSTRIRGIVKKNKKKTENLLPEYRNKFKGSVFALFSSISDDANSKCNIDYSVGGSDIFVHMITLFNFYCDLSTSERDIKDKHSFNRYVTENVNKFLKLVDKADPDGNFHLFTNCLQGFLFDLQKETTLDKIKASALYTLTLSLLSNEKFIMEYKELFYKNLMDSTNR